MKKLTAAIFLIFISSVYSQWVQTGGPYGGDISCFAVNGSDIYAGTKTGGVYHSTNLGVEWKCVNNNLPAWKTTALLINNGSIYAAVNGIICVSSDQGNNWNILSEVFAQNDVKGLVYCGGKLFAALNIGGIFSSTDNGITWVPAGGNVVTPFLNSLFVEGNNLYAGGWGGVYYTDDFGASWHNIGSGLPSNMVSCLYVTGNNIFAGTWGDGIYCSSDKGASWTSTNTTLNNLDVRFITANGQNIFAATYHGGVSVTTNMGANWTVKNTGLDNTWVTSLAVSGNILFAGTSASGVYSTSNGGDQWTAVNSGIKNLTVKKIAIYGSNIYAAVPDNGLMISSDNGAAWAERRNGLTESPITSIIAGPTIYTSTQEGIFSSTDNGVHWNANNNNLTNKVVNVLALKDNYLYAGTTNGVFVLQNGGADWSPLNAGLSYPNVTSFAIMNNKLIAGTGGGEIYSLPSLIDSWVFCGNRNNIKALAVLNGSLFVGSEGSQLLWAWDGAQNWCPVSFGLTGTKITALLAEGSVLLAATDSGVFVSKNFGTSWMPVNDGLEKYTVSDFTVKDNYVYAATYYGGVWKRALSEIVGTQKEQNNIPKNFELLQNYPNPFNPATTITYKISAQSFVRLGIFDLLGREIALLVNENKSAGTYTVKFNASNLPSGIYLYRLEAGNYTITKKMTLLK